MGNLATHLVGMVLPVVSKLQLVTRESPGSRSAVLGGTAAIGWKLKSQKRRTPSGGSSWSPLKCCVTMVEPACIGREAW